MKEVLLFLAAVVVPIMLVGAMYKQRLCKRSDWMRGLLAAEDMHKQGCALGDIMRVWLVLGGDAYAEGFLDYVESTAAKSLGCPMDK